MNIMQAALLGIVEGVTEYLPISSTFHLIWTARLLGIEQSEFLKAFEVIIQSGAILAVIILYVNTALKDSRLIKNIIISFVPTAVIGLLLYPVIKTSFFENFWLQIIVLAAVGVVFLIFEKWVKTSELTRGSHDLTQKEAFLIGLAQALAVFPGVSRAGAVILTLMLFKLKRAEAAKYSFLLAVPTLFAASGLDIIKSREVLLENTSNLPLLGIGFLFSFLSATVVVKWFIRYLQKNDLTNFGWYRIVLAILLTIAFFR